MMSILFIFHHSLSSSLKKGIINHAIYFILFRARGGKVGNSSHINIHHNQVYTVSTLMYMTVATHHTWCVLQHARGKRALQHTAHRLHKTLYTWKYVLHTCYSIDAMGTTTNYMQIDSQHTMCKIRQAHHTKMGGTACHMHGFIYMPKYG